MSKSAFNTVLNDNIKDNNNKFITPARHRSVLTTLRDFIGWLSEVNTWTAINVFSGGTRTSWAEITGSGTVTITDAKNNQLIKSGVTQVNYPSSPTDGDWYNLKNVSGGSVTLTGNGNNLYTSSSNATRTLINGSSFKAIYSSSDGLWYNT